MAQSPDRPALREKPRNWLPVPPCTVSNSDQILLNLLYEGLDNPNARGPLIDYLRDHDDPRADPARELAAGVCAVPAIIWGNHPLAVYAGSSWWAWCDDKLLTVEAYPRTNLYVLLGRANRRTSSRWPVMLAGGCVTVHGII